MKPMSLVALLLLALAAPVGADDAPAPAVAAPAPLALGEKPDDLLGPALEGGDVRLADLAITKEKAWTSVAAAAVSLGAKDPKPETEIAALPGVKGEDGDVDDAVVETFVGLAGRTFGLLSTEEAREGMKTLADVAAWIEKSAGTPVVLVVWSPTCKSCKNGQDAYLTELVAATGIRLVAVGSKYTDTPEAMKEYLDAHPWFWRVVLDPDRKLSDRLGGKKTPHAFLLDREGVLRYRGALQADVAKEDGSSVETIEYLKAAIEEVRSGKPVTNTDTEPAG